MSMILSHETARLYHRLQNRPAPRALLPACNSELKPGAADVGLAARARRLLIAMGAPPDQVVRIDVIVRRDCDRRSGSGITSHVWRFPIPRNSLIQIDRGIFVTGVLLTAQLFARQADERELVEYLMELCGCYGLPPASGEFAIRLPLITPERILEWAEQARGQHGANKLRRALVWVRAGARSPMETAFFMMLLLPRRLGGMQIAELRLAYRIEVTGEARGLTRRGYFECDAYLPCSRTDFEYNGIVHETEEQLAIDSERLNALEAMGYNAMIVTRREFFDREAFGRLMRAIGRRVGKRPDREPPGFEGRQEELREFVLRRYLGAGDGREAERPRVPGEGH